jgi:hypothetical protein
MKHIVAKLLGLIALACSLEATARAESFAKRVDIGGGRMMYIECHGSGLPTVLLISGTDTASDLWHAADQKGPTVYDNIQKTTRVCAYDRPGAPHLDQTLSRSDPVPQPTSPQNGVDDLVALLKAAGVRALMSSSRTRSAARSHGSSPASIQTKSKASCSLTSSRRSFVPR